MLIGLTGFAGSGKNEVAKILQQKHDYVPLAFADAIKDMVSILFGWPRDKLEGINKDDRIWREQIDEWWSKKLGFDWSPRIAMQVTGTKLYRDILHSDIWVFILERRLIDLLNNNKKVVISDCRFPNEMDLVKKYGNVYQVVRELPKWQYLGMVAAEGHQESIDRLAAMRIHESEWKWLSYKIDGKIDNQSTLEELDVNVKRLLSSLGEK